MKTTDIKSIQEVITFLQDFVIECEERLNCGRCDDARECVRYLESLPLQDSLPSEEEIRKYMTAKFRHSKLLPEIIAYRAIQAYQAGLPSLSSNMATLDSSPAKDVSDEEEFHIWIIPDSKKILLEDRGGGIPVGATEHLVFDNWDGALKLCHFLEKIIYYSLDIDNDAGRFAEDSIL